MKHRTRRSKLRRMRQRRHTLRRGGRNCSGINKADFSLRMKEHVKIIADMSKIYKNDPHHVFTREVKELKEKHCEEFLKELIQVIDDVYGKYKKDRLKMFYDALMRREDVLIEQNLNNT